MMSKTKRNAQEIKGCRCACVVRPNCRGPECRTGTANCHPPGQPAVGRLPPCCVASIWRPIGTRPPRVCATAAWRACWLGVRNGHASYIQDQSRYGHTPVYCLEWFELAPTRRTTSPARVSRRGPRFAEEGQGDVLELFDHCWPPSGSDHSHPLSILGFLEITPRSFLARFRVLSLIPNCGLYFLCRLRDLGLRRVHPIDRLWLQSWRALWLLYSLILARESPRPLSSSRRSI